MQMYVIERTMPGVEQLSSTDLRKAAVRSCEVLGELAPNVQWIESYVCDGRIICRYLAEDEDGLRTHAERAGLPADRLIRVHRRIDPTFAG